MYRFQCPSVIGLPGAVCRRVVTADTEHVTVRIYRVTQIPTPYMVENNLTKWAPGWNLTNTQENDGFFLRDNGMPVNYATLIIAWFATSALFHLWACIMGAFERYWFWYWRCSLATRTRIAAPCLLTRERL